MPFPLGDLKRAYGRSGVRGGMPEVRPYLLLGAEATRQRPVLAEAIAWYATQDGARRADLDTDAFTQLVGDYRFARCLAACIETTAVYVPADFEQAVVQGSASPSSGRALWTALQERGITSPSTLRLYLFSEVNDLVGGFTLPERRVGTLTVVAEGLGCVVALLEHLLWLDDEGESRLIFPDGVPSLAEVEARYNRRALETLLVRTLDAQLVLPNPDGAAIKRFYFAVKRAGLLCDLELEHPERGPAAGVRAALFGPLEVFGPRTRHGDRFAQAVLELLRAFPAIHGTARVLVHEREYTLRLPAGLARAITLPDQQSAEPARPAVATHRVNGAAVMAGQTPVSPSSQDSLDGSDASKASEGIVATLIDDGPAIVIGAEGADDGAAFDSQVERQLFRTLRGMEKRGDTRGWSVEREPEPIIHEGTVLVPDFQLTRQPPRQSARRKAGAGNQSLPSFLPAAATSSQNALVDRPDLDEAAEDEQEDEELTGQGPASDPTAVFVEVIGFWTPGYRERKKAKLVQVAGQVRLVLAIQEQLAPDFADLPFPTITYKHRVSGADLIRLVAREFGTPERTPDELATSLVSELRHTPPESNLLPEAEVRALLDCGPGVNLKSVAAQASADQPGWEWVPGLGLARTTWLAALGAAVSDRLASTKDAATALEPLREAIAAHSLPHADLAASHLDVLLPRLGYDVIWDTLFDATVRLHT